MKKIYLSTIAIALVGLTMTACNDEKKESASTHTAASKSAAVQLTTLEQKSGYAIGLKIGAQLAAAKDSLDADALTLGVQDAIAGTKPRLSDEEIQEAGLAFQKKVLAKQKEKAEKTLATNLKVGKQFLEANKKKEGVVTLPSGLQYKIIKAGTGATPKASDTVVTHYTGKLLNDQVFDSSVQRGEPATFPVSGVIAGWTEALQLMKTGAKWELYIPADLAYGERGAGQMIEPGSTLIFEIELLDIKK